MSSTNSSKAPFKKKTKKGSLLKTAGIIFLLIMIIAGFIVVPALSGTGGGGTLDFGRFGNQPIRYTQGSYFYNHVSYYNNMYRDTISDNPDFFEFYRNMIWRNAFTESVSFAAKKYFMEKSGFSVSTSAVDKMIVERGYFSDEKGNFDATLYSSTTNAEKERIRRSLTSSLFEGQYNADVNAGIYKSDEQIDFITSISPDERMISYVTISTSEFPRELVQEQARANSEQFRIRDLSRITLDSEKKANEVMKALEEGEAFSDLAVTYSNPSDYSAGNGGALPGRYYYEVSEQLTPEMADSIFSLETGSVSDPIETEYGWYVYQADSAVTDADLNDDMVIEKVRSWLTWNKGDVLDQWVNSEAEALISNIDGQDPSSFIISMTEAGKTVKQSDYFNLNWGGSPILGNSISSTQQDSVLSSALKSDQFYQEIFSLQEMEISQPISLGNSVLIAQLQDYREPETAVSDYYVRSYLQQSRETLWSDLANSSELFKDDFENVYAQFFSVQ